MMDDGLKKIRRLDGLNLIVLVIWIVLGGAFSGCSTPSPPPIEDTQTRTVQTSDMDREGQTGVDTAGEPQKSDQTFTPAPREMVEVDIIEVEPWEPIDVQGLSKKERLELLEHSVGAVRKIWDSINRGTFDLEALARDFRSNPDGAIEFVRQEIAFEQYPGLLRGPQGTLMTRAGNSLDQALLLQELLKASRLKTRVVHGRLSADDARRLLNEEMTRARPPLQEVFADVEKLQRGMFEMARLSGKTTEEAREMVADLFAPPTIDDASFRTAHRDAADLITALGGAGLTLGNPEAINALVEETRDYYWLEFAPRRSNEWKAVHPLFLNADFSPAVEPLNTWDGALPDELAHQVRLELIIERRVGAQLEEVAIMEPWTGRSADVINKPLTFGTIPQGFDQWTSDQPLDQFLTAATYVPSLANRLAPGARAFDLLGNVKAPEGQGPGKNIANGFGGAAGALGGLNRRRAEPEPQPQQEDNKPEALTAQWVQYTLISPGGEERVHRRPIFDRIGAVQRQRGLVDVANPQSTEYLYRLMGAHTLMTSAGAVPEGHILAQQLERFTGSRALVEYVVENMETLEEGNIDAFLDMPERVQQAARADWAGHPLLATGFETFGQVEQPHTLSYRPAPALVVHSRTRLQGSSMVEEMIDIVANPRRSFALRSGKVHLDPHANLSQGVWETRVERLFLEVEEGTSQNTTTTFEAARAQGINSVVLVPGDRSRLDALPLSEQTKLDIRHDLAAGHVVVVPARIPEGARDVNWWRVEGQSGLTLGIGEGGRGSVVTEYVLTEYHGLIGGAAVSLMFLPIGIIIGCEGNYTASCIGKSIAIAGGTLFAVTAATMFAMSGILAIIIGLIIDVIMLFGTAVGHL